MKIERQIISREFLEEIEPLLKKNKEEINYWDTPLKFDKDIYIYADISGNYRGYVARDGDKVVGYIGYWITPDVHNRDFDQASQDLFYVDKEHRGSWLGLKILKYSERDLKEDLDVSYILQQSPVSQPIGSLFKRMGYEEASVVYKKEI